MDLDGKKVLRQDVPTRWNSTFLMLQSALSYRRAFQHLELIDYNFKHCPTSGEWEKAEKIKKFLAVFYDVTLVFSSTKYPTANLYFPQVFIVYFTLKKESIRLCLVCVKYFPENKYFPEMLFSGKENIFKCLVVL